MLLGALNYLTGPWVSFSIFYLIPVSIVTWFVNRWAGILISIASVITWLIADLVWKMSYPNSAIPYWNAAMRLVLFLIVVFFMSEFRELNQRLGERVSERTAVLESEIAERKRAKERLRESQAVLNGIIATAMDGIITVNTSQYIVLFNSAAEEMFRCSATEAIGQPLDRFIPERFRTTHREHIITFGRTGVTTRRMGALRVISGLRADGEEFPIEASISQIEVAGQKFYTVILRDITERKRSEETLRESFARLSKKNRYETIISTVTRSIHQSLHLQDVLENAVEAMSENIDRGDYVGIYLVEGEEVILKAHKGFTDWYIERAGRIPYPKGFTWKTIIEGKSKYVADVDQDTAIGPAGRELGIKSYLSMPIRFEDKTVGCVNINSLKKNAFDEEELKLLETVVQQIEVAIGNAKQAEALRQSEEEIRKINEELERRVIERTAQLEAANKELEAFSYSVSHDLRAPLRAIDRFSRVLFEDHSNTLDDDGRHLIKVIRDNARNMGQLIDDLLTLSRLGRQDIKLSKLDIAGLAKAVFNELKPNTRERTPQLNINTPPNAYGDRALIHQVFVNLLSNAIKFTGTKENPIIEVGGYVEGKESIYYVRDNGIGFDMRYAWKLFGVFQRLHRQDEFEGTGVGLAIVQRVIHRHGGQVWAEGKVGEGATFYFTLYSEEHRDESK